MSESQIWLGKCYLTYSHQANKTDAPTHWVHVVARCTSAEGFERAVKSRMVDQGLTLLKTEPPLSKAAWLAQHHDEPTSENDAEIQRLISQVETYTSTALGYLYALSTQAETTAEAQSYLHIETLDNIEPLDGQFDVHPMKTVPDTLYEPLFGQPEPTEQEIEHYGEDPVPPMKLYAILDAAKIKVPSLRNLLDTSTLDYACLITGEDYEALKDSAPYIVELKDNNDFTRTLFTYNPTFPDEHLSVHLWHKEPGIYIRSRANLIELGRHFARFLMVQDENGKRHFFRFYAPETLRTIIAAFNGQQFETFGRKIHTFLGPSGNGGFICLSRHIQAMPAKPFEITNGRIRYEDFIDNKTLSPFIAQRIQQYESKAIDFLRSEFNPTTRGLSDDELRKVVQLAYTHAKERGISSEQEHLKYLIPVMFWGSYFESDPQYQAQLIRAGWLDEQGGPIQNASMASVLHEINRWVDAVKTDNEHPQRIVQAFQRLYQTNPDKVTFEFVVRWLKQAWPTRFAFMPAQQAKAFTHRAYEIAHGLNFVEVDGAAYTCLAHYFGYQFAQDPLYPWAVEALADDGRSAAERRLALGEAVLKHWKHMLGEQ